MHISSKFRRSLTVAVFILLIALQSISAAKTPDWVYSDTRSSLNIMYFTGYGEGNDRNSAESAAIEDARENIAEYIGSVVFSNRRTSMWDLGKDTVKVNYNSTAIQYSTAYDGTGMIVEESFYDTNKSCWVLVSIKRDSIVKAAESTVNFRGDSTDDAYYMTGWDGIIKKVNGAVNPFDLFPESSLESEYAIYGLGYGYGENLHDSIEKAQAEARAMIAESRLSMIYDDTYSTTSKAQGRYGGFSNYVELFSGALIFGSKQIAMVVESDGGVWVLVAAPKPYVRGWMLEDKDSFLNAALYDTQFSYPVGKSYISNSDDPKGEYKVKIDTFKISVPSLDMPEWVYNSNSAASDYYFMVGSWSGNDIYTSYRAADLEARAYLAEYCGSNDPLYLSTRIENNDVVSEHVKHSSAALIPDAYLTKYYFDKAGVYVDIGIAYDDLNKLFFNIALDRYEKNLFPDLFTAQKSIADQKKDDAIAAFFSGR